MCYFTIVTEFVEGRHPNKKDADDFKICYEALQKLHKLGVIHGDARPPNFIIKQNAKEACILDFGFSFILDGKINEKERLNEINDDIRKMKSNVGFNIDINHNEI